ncbi:hypothetical protein FRB98_009477, partial [Tulasnella sp. 332]
AEKELDAPILVAWHGGGLIDGSREDPFIYEPLLEAVAQYGWLLIRPDYRLVLPSNGYDMADDVTALFSYLASRTFASSLPSHIKPNVHNIVVTGFSAGGHLVRLSVIEGVTESKKSEPQFTIKANVPYYGMGGDYLLDYWTKYRHAPGKIVTEEEMIQAKENALDGVKMLLAKEAREVSTAGYTPGLEGQDIALTRQHVWEWWAYHSTFLDVITGEEGLGAKLGALPYEERIAVIDKKHARVVPQLFYEQLKIDKPAHFPQTLLIHGNKDESVPYEESLNSLRQLKEAGLPVELITVEGANHSLCHPGTEKRVDSWSDVNGRAVDFIRAAFV